MQSIFPANIFICFSPSHWHIIRCRLNGAQMRLSFFLGPFVYLFLLINTHSTLLLKVQLGSAKPVKIQLLFYWNTVLSLICNSLIVALISKIYDFLCYSNFFLACVFCVNRHIKQGGNTHTQTDVPDSKSLLTLLFHLSFTFLERFNSKLFVINFSLFPSYQHIFDRTLFPHFLLLMKPFLSHPVCLSVSFKVQPSAVILPRKSSHLESRWVWITKRKWNWGFAL